MQFEDCLKGDEKMDKDVKELLEWFKDEESDMILSSFVSLLENTADKKALAKIFSNEQLAFLKKFAETIIYQIDGWHNEEDEESHKDIRKDLKKFKAQFRNHRHNNTESYGGKAEY